MKTANASLQSYLASRRSGWIADLFDFVLANGTEYHWTSFDQSLQVGPTLYSALGPLIDRTKWGIKNTIEVPEMDIRIFSDGSDLPDGTNLKLSVHNGLFDYSTITLSRLFMPTIGDTSLGPVTLFTGNASQIEIDALSVTVTVKGANVQLAQYMPRNRFTLGCTHALYDANCAPNPGEPGGGPSLAANTYTGGIVTTGSTRQVVQWRPAGDFPPNIPNFTLGVIQFTSGVANGLSRTIQSITTSNVQVSYNFYEAPGEGDTFNLIYGCDHTRAGGCTFHNNLKHYRGFPYTPPEQYAL